MTNMESIRLSALGREVRVGNLYNYFSEKIISSCMPVLEQNVHTNESSAFKVEWFCFFQQPEDFKYHMLGINSHLKHSIALKYLDVRHLWFADYLETKFAEVDPDKCSTAQVDVILRIVKRIESLSHKHFEHSPMHVYQFSTGGIATHLVEEVLYGIEMICSMRRDVDLNCESQTITEEKVYLAAKAYFEEMTTNMNTSMVQMPAELEKVICITSTSLEAGITRKQSFPEFCEFTRGLMHSTRENRPIEIVLRCIPAQLEAQLVQETFIDIEFQKNINVNLWKWIKRESKLISKHPSVSRIPPLEKLMCQFIDLLPQIWKSIERLDSTEQVLDDVKRISHLLTDMKEWLIHRRQEIQITCSLLADNNLVMLTFEEIKDRQLPRKRTEVFILRMDYVQDPLMERMYKFLGKEETSQRPTFDIVSTKKRHLESAMKAFASLGTSNPDVDYVIGLVPLSSIFSCGVIIPIPAKIIIPAYPVGLLNSLKDSFKNEQEPVKVFQPNSMLFPPVKASLGPTVYNQRQQLVQEDKHVVHSPECYRPPLAKSSCILMKNDVGRTDFMSSVTKPSKDRQTHLIIPPFSDGFKRSRNPENKQATACDVIKTADLSRNATFQELEESLPIEFVQATATVKDVAEHSRMEKNIQMKRSEVSVAARIGELNAKSNDKFVKKDQSWAETETIEMDLSVKKVTSHCNEEINQFIGKEQCRVMEMSPSRKVLLSTQRIAEKFAVKSNLIKEGQPSIYQLKANKILANEDFRWFEAARPEGVPPSPGLCSHKIIILMGATGCGKSTLINGMVNYILGVQWNDPFRFECIREDDNVKKNQAHSQTSSVTAYTLRHQDGMTIPHSITIIDTPGYGDTEGIKRDKEITAKIHRFLTQQETRIDVVHAVCFVAASGDSRLTATQRYVIDSVLSIFGSDMKDNLRLLVTFADNAEPPVVEACGAAQFPATSSSGITYNKFNSSVLYSSNLMKHGECDANFDKFFWDMGQENFQKFFAMLVQMDGRSLTSTREVIRQRQQLDQSLRDIQDELEICLVNFEEIDKFRQQLRKYGHDMKMNENFVIEQTEMRIKKEPCVKGITAFNCNICKKTCEGPSSIKKFKNRNCLDKYCSCLKSAHEIQPFTWTRHPVKTQITLSDMKARFQSNSNRKLSTEDLMANCLDVLNTAKAKVISLLEQIGANASSLKCTALRSNALNPSDYLSLMKSRVLEEQAPGYLTRLQTLAEIHQSLNTSAIQGGSISSQMASRAEQNANTSRGRGRGKPTQSFPSATSQLKPDCPGRSGRDKTPTRSSEPLYSYSSLGQFTSPTATVNENGNPGQNQISGMNPNGSMPIAISQTGGRCDGRDKSLSNPSDCAATVTHGSANRWEYQPDIHAKSTEKIRSSEGEDCRNPDRSRMDSSATDPWSSADEETNDGDECKGKLADVNVGIFSSDEEADESVENKEIEKKSESFLVSIYQSTLSKWFSKRNFSN